MDPLNILVLNAGSSSLKFALFDSGLKPLLTGNKALQGGDFGQAVDSICLELEKAGFPHTSVGAIGQRVVHGGTLFQNSVRITPTVIDQIRQLVELAPLHNPAALETIQAAATAFPGLPQIAVFDTTYFRNLPERQIVYPVPYEWYSEWGVRRFGFHGISHSYCAERSAGLLQSSDLRLVSCHLGQGCSATASRGLQAVATSMGFTPLEGLMMGSRSGSVDPGLVLYVQRKNHWDAQKMDDLLNHQSGLLGISGFSSDFREVENAARGGHSRAGLAIDLFVDRVRSVIGAFAVTLGGIDALVFTGGVGQHSSWIRSRVCAGLEFLKLEIDENKNVGSKPDSDIATATSTGRILIIETQEEAAIAKEVYGHLKPQTEHGKP